MRLGCGSNPDVVVTDVLTGAYEQAGDARRFPSNRFVNLNNGKIRQFSPGGGKAGTAFGKLHPAHARGVERSICRFKESDGPLAFWNSRASLEADQKFGVE